jgi:hypothetical protein
VMKKAVIHHSDYQSTDKMKSAISLHFRDRNAYFTDNPRRAGKGYGKSICSVTPQILHRETTASID